ncbi:MAG: hypothetical protein U5R48_06180 [Gammaproteobacteria bacterium]|nr:hypothetical protein [Gammaproteobacteria bacterium]
MNNMSSQGLKETFAGLGGIQKGLVIFGVSLLLLALVALRWPIFAGLIGVETFAIFEQSGITTWPVSRSGLPPRRDRIRQSLKEKHSCSERRISSSCSPWRSPSPSPASLVLGQREEGLFTAVWVPSILCFGIYFKLIAQGGARK